MNYIDDRHKDIAIPKGKCRIQIRGSHSHSNSDFYYDLTDSRWGCINITEQGWELVDITPILLFVRYNHQTPLVQPSRDYAPDIFDRVMILTNGLYPIQTGYESFFNRPFHPLTRLLRITK